MIRLLSKFHSFAKTAIFDRFSVKFFGYMYAYALKIFPKTQSKTACFFKQSEFRKKSIILCGLPRSGKTTIGFLLAKHLKLDFLDTDFLLEEKSKKAVSEIYQMEGEKTFRKLEKQIIFSLPKEKSCVISIGGGSFNDQKNAFFLRSFGTIFYLKTPLEMLWERMKNTKIPSYLKKDHSKEDFFSLAKKREKTFEELSDVTIENLGTEKEALDLILKKMAEIYGK